MLINPKIQKAIDLRAKEGDLEKAKNYYLKSLDVVREEGWKREQGDALEKLADLYLREGNKEKALECIDEAIDIFTQIGYREQLERSKKLKSEI